MFVLIWLVDRVPDVVQASADGYLRLHLVVLVEVEVTNHKQQLLFAGLGEQFEVALENGFQNIVITSTVPANVRGPHVDEEHVRNDECEERGGLLEGRLLLCPLSRVDALDVEDDNGAVLRGAHPNAFGCLLVATLFLVEHLEVCVEQQVQQRRLATRLTADH